MDYLPWEVSLVLRNFGSLGSLVRQVATAFFDYVTDLGLVSLPSGRFDYFLKGGFQGMIILLKQLLNIRGREIVRFGGV